MQLVRDPTPEVAYEFLANELQGLAQKRGHLVQIVADCTIEYQGRARSMLNGGERLLLLKPDGTFLVHTASKAKPVNWQPPGAMFHADLEDNTLVLTSYRPKPEEIVKVTFHSISCCLAVPIHDEQSLELTGTEDDLQKLLFERPHLVEEGFVPRRRERDTKRGFYDIDGDDATGKRMIVEIKRSTAGVKEAQQLWRYVEDLREQAADGDLVRGMLVAPRVAPKARQLLADHNLEWQELDWDELLPQIQTVRRGGQRALDAF